MDKNHIKRLSHNAARLLLVFHYSNGTETLADLPALIEQAGLTAGQYARAFKQLKDLGFIGVHDGSICILSDAVSQQDQCNKEV
ncbi:MAG: hypothetical protein JO202_05850 [Ktedonobacteraceae bacterium]|nr:hypothetical protein [Ktedonobacteraceae bacterium]